MRVRQIAIAVIIHAWQYHIVHIELPVADISQTVKCIGIIITAAYAAICADGDKIFSCRTFYTERRFRAYFI